jgi:putative holliday junction resolvase
MRYLGIDYGEKRIGIALSDESGTLAFPHIVYKNSKDVAAKIVELIQKEKVSEVVIGESLDLVGKENPIMSSISQLKELIESLARIPVLYEPEFFTSVQAEKIQGKTAGSDASAASIILQSYLDRKKHAAE